MTSEDQINPAPSNGLVDPPVPGGAWRRIAVVVSRYNATVTDRLLEGASRAFSARHGPDGLTVVEAPGAFELPAICLAAARTGRFGGVLAIGCIIRGETRHDEYLAQAVTRGLVDVTLATGVPVSLAVLTVETPEQAVERAGGAHGNKGEEAMLALLATIEACESLAGRSAPNAPAVTTVSRPLDAPDKLRHAAGVL